jgi:hypothetical protein
MAKTGMDFLMRWRKRLQKALDRPTLNEAKQGLLELHEELEQKNQSAAASLMGVMEEILTLHRLGIFGLPGRSLKTTNCLENIDGLIASRSRVPTGNGTGAQSLHRTGRYWTQISKSDPSPDQNAILVPSGDQTGPAS